MAMEPKPDIERECLTAIARSFEAWCEENRYKIPPAEFRMASAACCRLWHDIYSPERN